MIYGYVTKKEKLFLKRSDSILIQECVETLVNCERRFEEKSSFLPKLAPDKFLSRHETAGEEFPSRLEAQSSGQRAGRELFRRHFSRVHRCYNSAVVHRRSCVSLGEGELKLNWRECGKELLFSLLD